MSDLKGFQVPPSGYRYEPTKAEQKAADLLRSKGWSVSAPTCPLCHGFGHIMQSEMWSIGHIGGVDMAYKPCPNGCPLPMAFYSNVATSPNVTVNNASTRQIVVADGSVGMRHGA